VVKGCILTYFVYRICHSWSRIGGMNSECSDRRKSLGTALRKIPNDGCAKHE